MGVNGWAFLPRIPIAMHCEGVCRRAVAVVSRRTPGQPLGIKAKAGFHDLQEQKFCLLDMLPSIHFAHQTFCLHEAKSEVFLHISDQEEEKAGKRA